MSVSQSVTYIKLIQFQTVAECNTKLQLPSYVFARLEQICNSD